jgi:DNA-binding transcriptional MerR regulator
MIAARPVDGRLMTPTHPSNLANATASDLQAGQAERSALRIGEVAKLTGLTTRTLRYWEEIGLISPSGYRDSGEREYSSDEVTRAIRIRELQDLLGFSLAEVRMVLDAEAVFDALRRVYEGDPCDARLLQMIDEAIVANDRLTARLDDSLIRIHTFRDEHAAKAERLRTGRTVVAARRSSEGRPEPEAKSGSARPSVNPAV